MTNEELKVLKDWMPELELMARYNDNSIDYQRYSALDMAIKALEQQSITWIVGKDNCRVAVRNMSIDKMQKICAIIGEEEQRPSEDCVSREDAIKQCGFGMTSLLIADCLRRLPSVTPKTSWIPVSERLPKAFRFVNCTCHSLIDDREDWVIETVYVPQPSDSPYSEWGNIPMLNNGDCEVVAWMYRDIPKPYKAESEEEG